ncbi:hypothetical protein HPB49_006733 [Dermacentor silvarum]|uniref:Uncharacterized protein n=1 Tax=Dermacentor silvarum TaxID=543639 RepID=A0ACB8DWW1_DERSI|nr:hypothetical protein HPB49_006733 [Dermacentor silvarum]
MADETPTLDPTSTPTPTELDEPEGEWTTPGKVRKPRLAARPSFDLHAVCVHLPALPSATSAQLLDILPAFIRAAKLPAHTCADVSVHLRNRNRLAILKTHHIELARRLLSVASIILAGRIYAVAPYLAAPTNSCRGVIHGIAPDATPEELLRDLDSYQADILLARRMGNTNSALITFAGMHVPFCVYYQRLEFRCRPHKPRAHHCTICLQYGHRTCACPGNQRLCPTCSTPISQPDEPHSCSPWCLHCQGHHTPFAEICPVRMQRHEACANAAKKQRLLHRQHWKSLNMSQPPVKPSNPSSISKVRASSSLLPTHAQWGGPAPASDPGVTNPCDSTSTECTTEACGIPHACSGQAIFAPAETCTPELTSRVTALTSLVEMQQARIEAQDQRTSNLETLISNRTQSLDNLNSTINKAFNDAPGPMEDKNHPFKRTHPVPALSVGPARKIKPATLLAPPNPSNNKHHGDHNNSVELPNGSLRKPHYLTLSYYKKQGISKTSQATELCTPTPPRRFQKSTPNYDVWVDSLRRTRSQATTTTEANPPSDRADPHLMRLWRRRKRLLSRIPWLILRSLLGPQPAPLPTIQKHLSEHAATSLLQQVTDMYIPPPLPSLYPEYTGPSNSGLDSPFTLPDLERALAQNKTGTTTELLPLHRDRHLAAYSALRRVIGYCSGLAYGPLTFLCTPLNDLFPAISAGRRQARAHFHDPFPPDTVTCYVDAAYYQTHGSTACVTMPTPLGIPITSTAGPFSLPTSSLSLELAVIVHATHELTLLPPSPRYRICSDCMAEIKALRDNRLPDNLHDDLSDALSLLSPALVTVVWVPGHAGIIGNKLAHELAREINSRAPTIPWPCPPIADEAHFYKNSLKQHYKHLRHSLQTLPPPHPPLQSPHYPNHPPPHWRVWLASAAFADQLAMVLLAEEVLV